MNLSSHLLLPVWNKHWHLSSIYQRKSAMIATFSGSTSSEDKKLQNIQLWNLWNIQVETVSMADPFLDPLLRCNFPQNKPVIFLLFFLSKALSWSCSPLDFPLIDFLEPRKALHAHALLLQASELHGKVKNTIF